jgi:protein SCO1/2
MQRLTFLLAGVALAAALAGCGRAPAPAADTGAPAAPANARTFIVKGVVRQLRTNGTTVVVAHEEIPDYMAAMTMPFEVKDPAELKGLQPGDAIVFRLLVTADDGWIDQVARVGTAPPPAPAPPDPVRRVPWVEPLAVGDLLPDYTLTNQLGQPFPLAAFRGRVLAFTFVFTRCPFPNFCPRMSAHFAEAARQLAARPDAPADWHLLSISFDPQFDTPTVLAAYGAKLGHDPARWTFATGAQSDLDALTEACGLTIARLGEGYDHNLRTVVVDRGGRVREILIGNEWKPEDLVAAIVRAAPAK